MTHSLSLLISNKGVCRTAAATPGLLIIKKRVDFTKGWSWNGEGLSQTWLPRLVCYDDELCSI